MTTIDENKALYDTLLDLLQQQNHLEHACSLLQWDMQCMMLPETNKKSRCQTLASLSAMKTDLVTDALKTLKSMSETETRSLSDFDRVNLSEIENVLLINDLPKDLVLRLESAKAKCQGDWTEQKKTNDWEGFSANLEEVVKCSREAAQIIQKRFKTKTLYDTYLLQFEAGMTEESIEGLFNGIKSWLPDMVQKYKVTEEERSNAKKELGPFEPNDQLEANRKIAAALGVTGRVDYTSHPFMTSIGSGSGDIRIATSRSPWHNTSMYGVIHESGHANYEIALANLIDKGTYDEKYRGTPALAARSTGVHEGQSIFYERQLGTHPEFIEWMKEVVGDDYLDSKVVQTLNAMVVPSFIRVEADEMTYPLHILLRFEIERDLINGVIEVKDIPKMWNEKMEQYLGINPGDDHAMGCMQDIHWSLGAFGYFPSYTIGALLAAQMMASMKKTVDVDEALKNRDMKPITEWLTKNVWNHASTKKTETLIEDATGEKLSDQPFRQFLESKRL